MPKAKPLVGEKTDQVTQHGRDVYVTEEGDNVSELSVTIPIGDKWYNAPSIYDGVRYEEGEVADMIKGGKIKPTSIHDSLEDALDAAQGRTDDIKYAKGGDIMNKQMNLFAEGGMMDNSGEVVNGVEVPPGSLKHEVADDVPAQLSEGEFVVPADVVRFIGLEKLMAMRDKAKAGLQRMQEMGQMGNAQEVDNPDQLFGNDGMPEEDLSGFESEIDSILAEDQPMFANGGAVMKFSDGGTPPDMTLPERNYARAPIIGFQMTKYTNEAGEVKYIPTIKGKPLLPVPEGFKAGEPSPVETPVVEEPKVEEPEAISSSGSGGGETEGPPVSGGGSSGGGMPGEGISIEGQDAAFKALQIAENPIAQVVSPIGAKLASFVANAYLDSQIDKMDEAAQAVKGNVVADTGMYTLATTGGGIGTVSNEASIQAQNEAVFGGYFDADGNFVETNTSIADQSRTISTNKTSDVAWQAKANLEAEQAAKAAAEKAAAEKAAAEKAAAEAEARAAAVADKAAADAKAAAARESSGGYLTQGQKESIANSTSDPIAAMNALSGWTTGSAPTSVDDVGSTYNSSYRSSSSSYNGGFSGGDGGGYSGGFGSMSGSEGASVGGGGEARGGFISPKTSAKRRAAAKKGLASKRK